MRRRVPATTVAAAFADEREARYAVKLITASPEIDVRFTLRRVLYRPDRMAAPETSLPVAAIQPADGWCDDPADPAYNQPVHLPHPASHEEMWRADGLYDVVVVIGHNDDPVVPGMGSAVFMHVAKPDYEPTAGCVAIPETRARALLARIGPRTRIEIVG